LTGATFRKAESKVWLLEIFTNRIGVELPLIRMGSVSYQRPQARLM
jgi:hypothetical protein